MAILSLKHKICSVVPAEHEHEDVSVIVASAGADTDVDWKEYTYHNGEDADPTSSASVAFILFPSCLDEEEEDEVFTFSYPGIPAISIRGESDLGATKVFKVTGMAIWSAKRLSTFLTNYPGMVSGRRVLELGAGTGLAGIVAHHLRASKVVLTDGDAHALQNLRYNVTTNTTITGDSGSIVCPQLIWGERLDAFHSQYGSFDVILACDCIYMNKCIAPFWETVNRMLTIDRRERANVGDEINAPSNSDTGMSAVLVYVNTCPAQDTFDVFAEYAWKYGFEEFNWLDENTVERDVHFFRRQTPL